MRTILLLALLPMVAHAQQSVYRCEQGGKISYSHEPCLGATVIDATPTQGAHSMSGAKRKGADVMRDERRQIMDKAWQPLTGLTHEQMNVERRRSKLTPEEKLHCNALDLQLPKLESEVASAKGGAKEAADARLHKARRDFYWLKC